MTKPAPTTTRSSPQIAEELRAAIQSLGDYGHVTVHAKRGLLYVYADDPEDAVARLHPLGAGNYGLSFHHHSGRWEPMPFSGHLHHVAQVLVQTLGPYLVRWTITPETFGSHH